MPTTYTRVSCPQSDDRILFLTEADEHCGLSGAAGFRFVGIQPPTASLRGVRQSNPHHSLPFTVTACLPSYLIVIICIFPIFPFALALITDWISFIN
jgi:hypothetical protein